MDVGEGSSNGVLAKDQIIQAGHSILLRLPNGDIRTQKLEKNTYVLISPFSFAETHVILQYCQSSEVWLV